MVSTVGRNERGMGSASIVRSNPWMCWSVDTVLLATADGMTGVEKKEAQDLRNLGLWVEETSGRSQLSYPQ